MPRFGELLIPLQSARLVAFALLVCAYERGPRNEVNVTWQGPGAADLWYAYNYIPYIIRLCPFVDTGHPGKRGALQALFTPWPDVKPRGLATPPLGTGASAAGAGSASV